MAKKEETKIKKVGRPPRGEQSQRQMPTFTGIASMVGTFQGFGKPPLGTYKTYREMRTNPTIALARAIATAPIRAASFSIGAKDDVQDDVVKFIEGEMKRHWWQLIRNVLFALDYGFASFEKVFDIKENQFVYRKLKPLIVDNTKIVVDRKTGVFEGLQQQAVKLRPNKCFLYSHDKEAGNLFGRSRHENCRSTAYAQYKVISERRGQYARKAAGIIPIIEYPVGESKDKAGAIKSNYELAVGVLQKLGDGNGITMPNTFAKHAGDLARSGVDLAKLKSWSIQFLETKGAHGKSFTDMLRHLESLMMRAWLVPERAGTEGQFGTKAEAGVQSQTAMIISDLLFGDILWSINQDLVNPLLWYNYGQEAIDSVYLEAGGIDPILREFLRKIVEKVLTEPANIDFFIQWLDVDALLDKVGAPKAEEIVIPKERTEEKTDDKNEATMSADVRQLYGKLASVLNTDSDGFLNAVTKSKLDRLTTPSVNRR